MNANDSPGSVLGDYISSLLSETVGEPVASDTQSGTGEEAGPTGCPVFLFDGPGVGIAVPKESSGEPVTAGECVSPGPDSHEWIAGIVEIEGERRWLVDCARLIQAGADPTRARYWLPVRDVPVVLAAPARPELGVLQDDDIVWRGSGGRRPWLAGTVTVSRQVLIDTAGIGSLLPPLTREEQQ